MTANRIHPDQLATDASLVRRLLADQFPHWAELPVTAVSSSGTENAIFRLGDEMVVRLPHRPVRDDQIEKLDRWLPRLAPRLPLAIPAPLARDATWARGRGLALSTSIVALPYYHDTLPLRADRARAVIREVLADP